MTFFAVILVVALVPIQAYFAAQVSSLQSFITPSSNQTVPVIQPRSPKVLAAAIAPLAPNCRVANCIALTFDDGPNPATTSKILDILAQQHVPATFFVVGKRVHGNEALLRRIYDEGNEIGNHSWSHSDFTKLTPDQIKAEVMDTQNAIVAAGLPAPRLFRPPYGALTPTVKQSIPLRIALWNEDPNDWATRNAAAVQMALLASARPGGVIDAHDIYQATADSLGPTITALKARQFTFVTMSQMMASDDPGPGHEFYGYKDKTISPAIK